MMTGIGMGLGGLGLVFTLLFVVAIVVGGIWVVGNLFPQMKNSPPSQRSAPPPSESPLEILKRRYASGEISKTEYEQMRRDLEV